jgi:N6-adenosine-specific RNA methylase IME4
VRELTTATTKEIRALIEAAPPRKRAALSKALTAAVKFLKDAKRDYRKACELNKLAGENLWRLGEASKKLPMETPGGDRQSKKASTKNGECLSWSDLGCTQQDGFRYRKIHEQYTLNELRAKYDEGQQGKWKLLRLSSLVHQAEHKEYAAASPPPTGSYETVVLDPPWPLQKMNVERSAKSSADGMDYDVASWDEIVNYPPPVADDAHVFMWTTHKYLPWSFSLFEAWEVTYVNTFVWRKTNVSMQPFNMPTLNCEFCIYGKVGKPLFVDLKQFFACFEDKSKHKHSEKPEVFYDMLRRVTKGPRLDMYNRRKIKGFETWGNEAK